MKTLFTNGTLQSFTPVFCIPFSIHWTLVIAFIGLLVTTNNVSFIVPLSVKYFLVYCRLEKFYTAISSVIGLLGKFVDWNCFGDGWCLKTLSGSTISSDLGKYTVILDGTNFMAAWQNSLGVWTTIWRDFNFWKMTLLIVLPMSSIGTFQWCYSLQNQHSDLCKEIFPTNG